MPNPSELFNKSVSIEPRTNGKVTKVKSFNKDMKRQWYGIYTGKKDSELVDLQKTITTNIVHISRIFKLHSM